jgi:hypothetical protein
MEVIGQPRPLYSQGNSPWDHLDRRLGGPQSRSGHSGEENNSQPLPGLEPRVIQLVAQRYTTELSRLLRNDSNEDEIKNKTNTRNQVFHSVHDILSSLLLFKKANEESDSMIGVKLSLFYLEGRREILKQGN